MRIWTAHLRPGRQPVLLKEAWSWWAFLLGPLWLAANRAWVPAVLYVAVLVAVYALVPTPYRIWTHLGLKVLAGLLGRDMVRWSLDRSGYVLAGVLAAHNADGALLRLLQERPELTAGVAGLRP